MSIFSYFRAPFPSTQGFSAYRMPGVAVHIPWLATVFFIGFTLCWPHPALRVFVFFWFLAGLYFGRDIAVYCHYAPLLTLIIWAGCMIVLNKAKAIAGFGAGHVVVPALLSIAVTSLVIFVAWKTAQAMEHDHS